MPASLHAEKQHVFGTRIPGALTVLGVSAHADHRYLVSVTDEGRAVPGRCDPRYLMEPHELAHLVEEAHMELGVREQRDRLPDDDRRSEVASVMPVDGGGAVRATVPMVPSRAGDAAP